MFERLIKRGFQVEFHHHARAILQVDFPDAEAELQPAIEQATIPIEEIIAGGGGEAKGTQRLRRSLESRGWAVTTFVVEKIVNGVRRESQSHKIDHVKAFGEGRLALEIEWNNKDPFFDRDLENSKRLHADGAISLGVIVTRGRSLHEGMRGLVERFVEERQIRSLSDVAAWGYEPTSAQRQAIARAQLGNSRREGLSFRDAFVRKFVADKFGEATTHWRKLQDRVARGVGNPCPLVLIGLPDSIVTFDEGLAALREVQAAESGAVDV